MPPKLKEIFHEAYRELRPRTPAPPLHIRFYPFVSINNTIRMRQGELYIRLSDLLEGAPDAVLHSIAHILLAKLYRKPVDRTHSARYRRHVASHDVAAKARLVRQMRGRKHIHSARGHHYHLEEIFDDLNRRFFHGLLGRPQLTWSQNHARSSLGH
ncbi:MAG: M48 family peptidase, partial [Terriglobales bacterium]